MTWWSKMMELVQRPAYTKTHTRSVKVEISKEEILELVRSGLVKINENGRVEVKDKSKIITAEARVIAEEQE